MVAGPGTGKTEFLVRRAVHLIEERGVRPDGLLVLTFSRRGAADLRQRIERRLDRSSTPIPASTFHSLCHRLLEAHAGEAFGWPRLPTLLTGPEQVALVGELLRSEDPAAWPAAFRGLLGSQTFTQEVADFVLRAQEHLLGPDGLEDRGRGRDDWRGLPAFLARYQRELRVRGRLDYGALQARAVELLDDPSLREQVAGRHRQVLVDEYQDTTVAQASLLERLSSVHGNLTVAADPYQSVYSFRGTELHNVADFPERFRDLEGRPARRLVLTTSFRVPEAILRAAERITSESLLPGAAGPVVPAPHAGRVDALVFDQLSHEAEWIAGEIQRLHLEEGIPYRAMGVLVRTKRRILPELSRALERRGIDHDPPDARLADRPAVRLVLDCVAAATQPDDEAGPDDPVRRLLLGPLFSLPLGRVRELIRTRRRRRRSWPEILREEVADAAPLADLLEDPSWARDLPAAEGFWALWSTLPQFGTMVADPGRRDHRAAWSSLAQALARQAERDPGVSLADYLRRSEEEEFEAQPLLAFREERAERLTLTTLHQAKGLEFEVVFIADATEGVFPDLRPRGSLLQPRLLSPSQPRDPAGAARFRLQEETRLAYTAMCRARLRVVWTATAAGVREDGGGVSRFLPLVTGGAMADLERPREPGRPVTPLEAEAHLRRVVRDPLQPSARRLAAADVLARGEALGLRHPSAFAGWHRPGPDRGLVPAGMPLSPSQAEAYEACPRRYVLERRLKVERGAGVAAALGGLVHEVLEETEGEALDHGLPRGTAEAALRRLHERWNPEEFGGGPFAAAWRRRAEEVIEKLYASWPTAGRVVAVEHRLESELGGVPWRGRADRIEEEPGTVRIVDYKTSRRAAAVPDAAVSLQLGFYLMAAREDPEVLRHGEPSEAELWYPGTRAQKVTVRRFDPSLLGDVGERLEAIGEGISAEDWTPRPGDHCRRCDVMEVCPSWPAGREAYLR